jgi:hypothetical protein
MNRVEIRWAYPTSVTSELLKEPTGCYCVFVNSYMIPISFKDVDLVEDFCIVHGMEYENHIFPYKFNTDEVKVVLNNLKDIVEKNVIGLCEALNQTDKTKLCKANQFVRRLVDRMCVVQDRAGLYLKPQINTTFGMRFRLNVVNKLNELLDKVSLNKISNNHLKQILEESQACLI